MLKTRWRSARPDSPPGGTLSDSRPRAAPGFGHPRPISPLEPRLVGQMGLVFDVEARRRAEGRVDGPLEADLDRVARVDLAVAVVRRERRGEMAVLRRRWWRRRWRR